MTHPTEPRVEVTQADREAVKAFHRAMAKKLFADIASGEPPTFGDDAGHDGDTIHQAFARHRTAAEAASRENEPRHQQVTAASKVLRDAGFSGDSYHTARLMLRAALRATDAGGDT